MHIRTHAYMFICIHMSHVYIDAIYLYLNVAKCAFGGFSGDDATPQELEVHADGNASGGCSR